MIGFDSSWQSVPLEMCRHFESSICYDRGAKSTDPCAADTIVPAQVVSIAVAGRRDRGLTQEVSPE